LSKIWRYVQALIFFIASILWVDLWRHFVYTQISWELCECSMFTWVLWYTLYNVEKQYMRFLMLDLYNQMNAMRKECYNSIIIKAWYYFGGFYDELSTLCNYALGLSPSYSNIICLHYDPRPNVFQNRAILLVESNLWIKAIYTKV